MKEVEVGCQSSCEIVNNARFICKCGYYSNVDHLRIGWLQASPLAVMAYDCSAAEATVT